jgi:hypothetical protein
MVPDRLSGRTGHRLRRKPTMPSFDGGHYFLTALFPVKTEKLADLEGFRNSPVQMIRGELARWPLARQSPTTASAVYPHLNSPFARSRRTHFARFAVIGDVIYEGRNPQDAIVTAVTGTDPLIFQHVDQLTCPFLLLAVDFDADSGDERELKGYLAELWTLMAEELKTVLCYCVGFDKVTDAASFADYVVKCQIETTMPFNDYWIEPPPLASTLPRSALYGVGFAVVAFGLLWAVGFTSWRWPLIVVAVVAVVLAALYLVYRLVMRDGAKPFPTAPNSTLPAVLKALYLQQKVIRLAVRAQGVDNAALHRMFGEFLEQHAPTNLAAPTQAPGVIGTPGGAA